MMIQTISFWGFKQWLTFWFGGARGIVLKGITLDLREHNYLAKIADLAMAWEVLVDEVYDEYPILPGDTVLDIGGHIGSFSSKAALLAHEGSVYTCEPFPPTFEVLSKNSARYPNLFASQVAISDKNGIAAFYYSTSNPAENSLVRASENCTEVTQTTLGDFLKQNDIDSVDLMKIDCEGAEYDILYGARDHLHKIKKMVMEIHEPKYFGLADRHSIDTLMAYLSELGFQVRFKRENKYQGYIYAHQ